MGGHLAVPYKSRRNDTVKKYEKSFEREYRSENFFEASKAILKTCIEMHAQSFPMIEIEYINRFVDREKRAGRRPIIENDEYQSMMIEYIENIFLSECGRIFLVDYKINVHHLFETDNSGNTIKYNPKIYNAYLGVLYSTITDLLKDVTAYIRANLFNCDDYRAHENAIRELLDSNKLLMSIDTLHCASSGDTCVL